MKNKETNNKMKYLKLIASFMITLIITLPLYSASVYAGLSNIMAKGSDNVNNYIKEQDYVVFEATASISGDEKIDRNQIWLGQNFRFDSCTKGIEDYECKLRYPANGTMEFVPRAQPYTIILKDDDGNIVESKSNTLYVDTLPPSINSFSVEPNLVKSGNVKFKYSIKDKACTDESCENKCSGIKNLELYKIDASYNESVPIDTPDCSYNNEFLKDSASFGEGQHTIYARAYDRLGKASDAAPATFKVDNQPPQINPNSFKITDETGLDINYASPQAYPVKAYVEIIADDLDKENVIGNFTSINPSYSGLEAECGETIDSITKCTWQINLASQQETTKEFVIEAKDLAGNKEKVSLPKTFRVDNAGPEVNAIKTDRVKDGKSYAKLRNNTFIAEFMEEGVGLNPNNVVLYVGTNVVRADNCTSGWSCYWYGVDVSGGAVRASIKDDTTDRLGNKVSGTFNADIIVDTNVPVLKNLSVKAIDGRTASVSNYTKTGDNLQIAAIVEDEAIKTAYADLSFVIANAKKVNADSCVNIGGNKWQCSWITSSIDISGYIENFIYLNFEDVAGNVLRHQEAISVYGLIEETVSNYWDHEVECSPKLIDRQTAPLINQKVFCHVKLKPLLIEDVVPLSASLGECSNDTTAVQNVEVFNSDAGSKDPYIKLTLKKSKADLNEINLNCPLFIMTKVGRQVTRVPEEENIAIKLEFYNMPLGELSESVKEKVDEAVDDATKGIWKFITILRKVFFYGERVCQFGNMFYNIVALWQTIAGIKNLAALKTVAVPPVSQAFIVGRDIDSCTSSTAKEAADEGWKKRFNQFCNMVNCKVGRSMGNEQGFEKWSKLLGGGSGLRTFFEDVLPGVKGIEKYTGKTPFGEPVKFGPYEAETFRPMRDITGANGYMNIKDSLVLSALTVCIPGIIYNLDKYRQIQCMYANCLQEGVKQQGLPVMACEDQKAYAECKYVVGEVFKVIPFTAVFNYYTNLIKYTLSDPFRILGVALAYSCKPVCKSGTLQWPWAGCAVVKIATMIGETAEDITNIIHEGVFKIREDYCSKIKEEGEEEEEKEAKTAEKKEEEQSINK